METIPEEGKPEFYTVNGLSYHSQLGEPVLGAAAAELAAAKDTAEVAEQINNVGDAICYIEALQAFDQPFHACYTFAQLLGNDYDEVGIIRLSRHDNGYTVVYVEQDGVFYPFSPFDFSAGELVWPGAPAFGTDLDALAENLRTTFPYHPKEPMHFYSIEPQYTSEFHVVNHVAYAHPLGAPVLGEEVERLVAEEDPAAAAEQITNEGDAIRYMQSISKIRRKEEVAKVFAKLIAEDYDEVGTITLSGPDARCVLVYVLQDGLYYPFDPFNFQENCPLWRSPLEGESDLEALGEKMMVTCPYHRHGKPMTSYKTERLYSASF